MESLLKNAQTTDFWVSVVLVGIVLNIIAAFLYRWMDGGLSKISKAWSERSERERQRENRIVERLVGSSEARLNNFKEEMRSRFRFMQMFLVGLMMFFAAVNADAKWGEALATSVGVAAFFFGLIEGNKVVRYKRLDDEARHRIAKENPPEK